MKKDAPPFNADIIRTCTVFALSLGLRIYIMGVLAGGWLDRRFDTAPLFLLLGVLAAIGSSFYYLIHEFNQLGKKWDLETARQKAEVSSALPPPDSDAANAAPGYMPDEE